MSDLIIPGWALFLFSSLGVGLVTWLVWLTRMTARNQRDIAVNTANDQNVAGELLKINNKMDAMKDDLRRSFDKMESRVDGFIASELTLLKEIIRK